MSLAVQAQTFEQWSFLRLNETPMSVRAQAMGAISDDDVSTNPAATAALKAPVFSLSGSQVSYELTDLVFLTPNTITSRRQSFEQSDLAHVSLAVPLRGLVVGAWYRNEPRLEGIGGFAREGVGPWTASACHSDPEFCAPFLFAATSPTFTRRDRRYGASIALERGPFSFGAGAEVQQLDERMELMRTRFQIEPARMDRILRRTSGSEVVPVASVQWKVTPRVALAAGYKGAATFRRTSDACYALGAGCGSEYARIGESELRMADSYRASVSIRPIDRLQLVAEAVRRNYGSVNTNDESLLSLAAALPFQDVTELHAGAEYRFNRIALRGGWWRDPARTPNAAYHDYALGNRFDHTTLGAGIDLGGGTLDIAVDDPEDDMLRRASIGVTFAVPSLQGR